MRLAYQAPSVDDHRTKEYETERSRPDDAVSVRCVFDEPSGTQAEPVGIVLVGSRALGSTEDEIE